MGGCELGSEIPESCKGCYIAESCRGGNPRRENGWKCPFPVGPVQVQIDPQVQVRIDPISINPWQFEGFWYDAMSHGRRTTMRRGL